MKRLYCALFITLLHSTIYTESASAQINVEQSYFTGKGLSLSTLITGDTGTKERLFLYNVGKDMFLNAGGFWGTRTATFTVGLPLTFEKKTTGSWYNKRSYYTMSGPFNNKETGSYIGRVDYATGNDAYRRNGVFYDRGNVAEDGINWTFVEASNNNGDVKYYIKCEKTNNSGIKEDYWLVANQEMTIQVFEGGNNNLVKALSETDKNKYDDKYAQWKVVTEDEMIQQFSTTYDKKDPSDATFLMKAQNFNRMNMYNNDDNQTAKQKEGWQKEGSFKYLCGTDIVLGSGQNNDDHGDGKYGMFYCGGITDATAGSKLYQTVTIKQSGWYRIDCQGFFYNKTSPDDCLAKLYAKTKSTTDIKDNTAASAYINLKPKSYGEPFHALNLTPGQSAIIEDGLVSNKIEAGVTFYAQTYQNSLLVYINFDEEQEKDGKQLELGIEVTKAMADDDVIYFDDFQLKYLGESFALDEGKESLREAGDEETVYKNRVMILKRSLKAGKWNGLTLPVNLTKQQLNTAFFPNPRIAVLTDMSSPLTISFKLIDLTKKGDDDIVVEAGKNYIINPGYEGRQGDVEIGDSKTNVITGPYYTIDRVSFKPSDVTEDEAARHTGDAEGPFTHAQCDCKLQLYGCYQRQNAPATAYMLYGGDMYHLTSPYRMKGFDCWIEDEHQVENPKARHKMGFSTYLDGVSDGETTDIYEALTGKTDKEDGTIYNMQGQMVGGNGMQAAQLPKGIYVRNGRKFIVR